MSPAALNMAAAQLLGTVAPPAIATSLLEHPSNATAAAAHVSKSQQYTKLTWEVVAPLLGGVLQLIAASAPRRWAPSCPRLSRLARMARPLCVNVLLVVLLWLIFCKARPRSAGLTAASIGTLAASSPST